jgi:hypothetical protein
MFDCHGLPGFILCDARAVHMNPVHSSPGLDDPELRSLFGIPLVQGPRNKFPSPNILRFHRASFHKITL